MNKVELTGRLTRNPELRYSQSENPIAVARYTLAVNRKYKKEGEREVDFIDCIVFGKSAEFAEKYFEKGLLIGVIGRLQVSSWKDENKQAHYKTEVIVDEHEFLESKKSFESHNINESNKYTANVESVDNFDMAYINDGNIDELF